MDEEIVILRNYIPIPEWTMYLDDFIVIPCQVILPLGAIHYPTSQKYLKKYQYYYFRIPILWLLK